MMGRYPGLSETEHNALRLLRALTLIYTASEQEKAYFHDMDPKEGMYIHSFFKDMSEDKSGFNMRLDYEKVRATIKHVGIEAARRYAALKTIAQGQHELSDDEQAIRDQRLAKTKNDFQKTSNVAEGLADQLGRADLWYDDIAELGAKYGRFGIEENDPDKKKASVKDLIMRYGAQFVALSITDTIRAKYLESERLLTLVTRKTIASTRARMALSACDDFQDIPQPFDTEQLDRICEQKEECIKDYAILLAACAGLRLNHGPGNLDQFLNHDALLTGTSPLTEVVSEEPQALLTYDRNR